MGRGRLKGRKLSPTDHDDIGEEEKVPLQKKRGRPLKSPKNKMDEEEQDEDSENNSIVALDEEAKSLAAAKNGKRIKGNAGGEEKADPVKEENGNGNGNGNGIILCIDESSKLKSLRPNGNRRKSKPRRAAEACVECI